MNMPGIKHQCGIEHQCSIEYEVEKCLLVKFLQWPKVTEFANHITVPIAGPIAVPIAGPIAVPIAGPIAVFYCILPVSSYFVYPINTHMGFPMICYHCYLQTMSSNQMAFLFVRCPEYKFIFSHSAVTTSHNRWLGSMETGLFDAVADLYFLSHGDHFVGTFSSNVSA